MNTVVLPVENDVITGMRGHEIIMRGTMREKEK
jgi:hypothetical protein